ncbi:MAG: hypothetical protein K2G41_06650 [Duncaniella sp.]|uniref:hypothetical protein n=1 Tax=Duncaniella sp. TaxID=2518496 RepID=UPI0023D4A791|nr:hypothetical protein [Duncaniella sp.]MDE6090364.1 hypothetical protein [Duncaniella sp.]
MTEGQFYIRLILNVIVGIMFAYALYKMAKHNNHEATPLPHKVMHVIGWILIGVSIICLFVSVYYLTIVDFPQQLRGPFIGPNTIIRLASAVFYWGYPTLIQNSTLTMALATFDFLGIGAYFLYFKSSHSKWWKKVLKIFVVLLLYAFMASATNFHYFDFPEFISPILYCILWIVIVNRKDKPIQSDRNEIEFVKEEQLDIFAKSFSGASIDDSVVCLNSEEASNENQNPVTDKATPCSSLGEEKVDTVPTQPDMQFCRYCGKKIETDSSFCKYCGGKIVGSKSSIIDYTLQIIRNKWAQFIQKMRHVQLSLFKTKTNRGKIKRTMKWIVISLLSLAIIGVCSAICYYFDEVRPQQEAERILADETSKLNNLTGDDLFVKCDNIIRYHSISRCGKEWRDRDNLNDLTSLAWAKISVLAERGNADAQFLIALRYNGYDFSREVWNYNTEGYNCNPYYDMEKAAYWYLQAAEQGHSTAQNNLGQCYENGTGVEADIREAIKWYRLSAENGNSYGQLNLGDCFRDGHKTKVGGHWEKDAEAYYYSWNYKMGYHMVDDYETIIKQDLDSAKYYWYLSATQGNKTAKERLQKIY